MISRIHRAGLLLRAAADGNQTFGQAEPFFPVDFAVGKQPLHLPVIQQAQFIGELSEVGVVTGAEQAAKGADPDDFAGDPPRQIMHEYGQEMRFDEKPPVRGLHKNLPAHPPDFRRETLLVGKGAEMLDDAVAVGYVVAAVGLRQLAGVAHRQREAR